MQSPRTYTCPTHGGVRRSRQGYCPQCGASLVPEGSAISVLSDPVNLALMTLALIATIAVATMLAR